MLVVAAGIAAASVLRDAYVARGDLTEARGALAAAASAVLDGDVERARPELADARAAVAAARARTDGALWGVADRVPLAGRSTRTVRAVVDVAAVTVEATDGVVDGLEDLLGGGGAPELRIEQGQVDLGVLDRAARVLDGLPVAELREAHRELVAVPATWIPAEVREGRTETIELAAAALRALGGAEEMAATLPSFLGADGPRRYFVGVQTPAELRATGGLLGFYAILTVDGGRMTVGEPVVLEEDPDEPALTAPGDETDVARRLGQLGREQGFVVPAPDDYRARYEHVSAGGHFSNVNVDPHLPVVAEVLLSLYEHHTDEQLDGLILLDPMALATLLEPVGPIDLDPAVLDADGRLPERIAPGELVDVMTHEIYEVYGQGRGVERRAFYRDFATRSFDAVFTGTWDGLEFIRGLGDAAAGRHLQVFSTHGGEQAAFETIGVAGAFGPSDGRSDFLALTANNAVGGKMDVHLGHRVAGELRLELPPVSPLGHARATRRAALEVTVDNPLPDHGMDLYIIGNCVLGRPGGCFEGPPGVNRTWFTVWTPDATRIVGSRDDGGVTHAWSGALHGLRTHDRYLETPPESQASFGLDLAGDVDLVRDGDELIYRLAWWRQAKAVPDLLDLTVVVPRGWSVASARVDGGSTVGGTGVHGDAEPVALEVEGDRVRVSGAAVTDVTVEIRLDRSIWRRIGDWLREPAF